MIRDTPAHPAFTEWVVQNGLLHEPLRIIDVGCQGGLHRRWNWLGDKLEAWAFDPLPEVIDALSAKNPAPERIRYFCMGLGNEDGDRLFERTDNAFQSAFLPAIWNQDDFREKRGMLPPCWSATPIRKLDTLMADGAFP